MDFETITGAFCERSCVGSEYDSMQALRETRSAFTHESQIFGRGLRCCKELQSGTPTPLTRVDTAGKVRRCLLCFLRRNLSQKGVWNGRLVSLGFPSWKTRNRVFDRVLTEHGVGADVF
jgi:hypothetical protein